MADKKVQTYLVGRQRLPVHASCYLEETKSLDSKWRGTTIESIPTRSPKGKCSICRANL